MEQRAGYVWAQIASWELMLGTGSQVEIQVQTARQWRMEMMQAEPVVVPEPVFVPTE